MPRKPFLIMPQIRKALNSKPPKRPAWAIGPMFYDDRPDHVAKIGECLMWWPPVEIAMAELLAALLRANTDVTVAVYLTLRRQTARDEAILEAGKIALDFSGTEMLEAILSFSKSVEAERNSLAHGYWGHSHQIPKDILWISSADVIFYHIDLTSRVIGTQRKMNGFEWE